MNLLRSALDPFRRLGLGSYGLRPRPPGVAVEVTPEEVVLVRVRRRRGRTSLEAHHTRPFTEPIPGSSLVRSSPGAHDEARARIREVFDASGTRPGRVALVLPDSLAKVTLLQLPEAPSSKKQLAEMVRFKLRKAIPFKLEEASISYQLLPSEGTEASALVAVMLRSTVEQYERDLEGVGARPGMVSLCTPNLFNLCREAFTNGAGTGGDVALLNCAPTYFSLLIVRDERLIFYRCKSAAVGEEGAGPLSDGVLSREIATSFSYYQEKLAGQGIRAVYVRTVSKPFDELRELLERLGAGRAEAIDVSWAVTVPQGLIPNVLLAHRIAPAIGAAARGR